MASDPPSCPYCRGSAEVVWHERIGKCNAHCRRCLFGTAECDTEEEAWHEWTREANARRKKVERGA